MFAARKIMDGEEGEEETRTKKTMVKQVKSTYELSGPSRRGLSPVSVAWSDKEYFYSPQGGMAGVSPGDKRIWSTNRIPEHFHN